MISSSEYKAYHSSHKPHTYEENRNCFLCRTFIDEDGIAFWIGKRALDRTMTYLFFHEQCFIKIAGNVYNVQHCGGHI
jgi:uncharacterized protein YdeI (YjbR/CyaY-like superfamily)